MVKRSYKLLAKRLWWDLKDSTIRKSYKYYLIARIPGFFGIMIREDFWCNKLKRCGKNLIIKEGVTIYDVEQISIGDSVSIGINCVLEGKGKITIGSNVLIGPQTTIFSTNHIFEDNDRPIKTQGLTLKEVIIGNDVWIGSKAFIMPGANIEDSCVISAGSVVGGRRYIKGSILAGNPARVIGHRN
ncbi:DapH/DapD/GlmU-related protein [Desulfosarcina cetonica]|uniref:acyltransferase n=1 Tax=Desulfosarcina cetonica TaxID=90730 RepID=UPI0009FA229B|nr:acyltransferase [Desulfosarcina cetonica]